MEKQIVIDGVAYGLRDVPRGATSRCYYCALGDYCKEIIRTRGVIRALNERPCYPDLTRIYQRLGRAEG